jgi:hypothetical protein
VGAERGAHHGADGKGGPPGQSVAEE